MNFSPEDGVSLDIDIIDSFKQADNVSHNTDHPSGVMVTSSFDSNQDDRAQIDDMKLNKIKKSSNNPLDSIKSSSFRKKSRSSAGSFSGLGRMSIQKSASVLQPSGVTTTLSKSDIFTKDLSVSSLDSTVGGLDYRRRRKEIRIRSPIPPIPSLLTLLPENIALKILSYLDIKSLCISSQVCRSWYPIANNNSLWLEQCFSRGWAQLDERLFNGHKIKRNDRARSRRNSALSSIFDDHSAVNWKKVFRTFYCTNTNWIKGHFDLYQIGPKERLLDHSESFSGDSLSEEIEKPMKKLRRNTSQAITSRRGSLGLVRSSNAGASKRKKSEELHAAHNGVIYCIHMINSDEAITSSKDGSIKIWNYHENKLVRSMLSPKVRDSHNRAINDGIPVLSLAYGSNYVIGGLSDGSLVFWNSMSGEMVCHMRNEHKDGISSLEILNSVSLGSTENLSYSSSTLMTLITSSFDGTCRVYSLESFALEPTWGQKVDVHQLVSHRGKFKISLVRHFKKHMRGIFAMKSIPESHCGDGKYPDKCLIASGGLDATILLWDVYEFDDENIRTLSGHQDTITSLNSTDKFLVSGSMDKTVRVWNHQKGEQIRILSHHEEWIKSISIYPGECREFYRLLTSGFDGKIRVWNLDARTGSVNCRYFLEIPIHRDCDSTNHKCPTPMFIAQNAFGILSGDQHGRLWNFNFEDSV